MARVSAAALLERAFFLEPDNLDEWPAHFEAAGFTPLAQYYSALNGDIARHTVPGDLGPSLSRQGFVVRSLDVHDTEAEIHRLWEIASSAFARHFLYTPIAEDEFVEMQRPLLAFVRPELVQVAETNGRAVGFCFAIPDVLQARRGETIDTVVFHTIAVLPEHQGRGIASLLVASVAERARRLGSAARSSRSPTRTTRRGDWSVASCATSAATPCSLDRSEHRRGGAQLPGCTLTGRGRARRVPAGCRCAPSVEPKTRRGRSSAGSAGCGFPFPVLPVGAGTPRPASSAERVAPG